MLVNIQADGQAYKQRLEGPYTQMRTDRVYRQEGTNGVYIQEDKEQEGKDTRTLYLNDETYLW